MHRRVNTHKKIFISISLVLATTSSKTWRNKVICQMGGRLTKQQIWNSIRGIQSGFPLEGLSWLSYPQILTCYLRDNRQSIPQIMTSWSSSNKMPILYLSCCCSCWNSRSRMTIIINWEKFNSDFLSPSSTSVKIFEAERATISP